MNFHLLQHRKLSEVLSIPNGLEDLMADIAREVLRYQPSNIECFIADYLESLVLTRELIYIADRTIDDILNNSIQVDLLIKKANLTVDEAVNVMNIAEEELRNKMHSGQFTELEITQKIIDKCNLKDEQAEKITEIILNSWHHFYRQNLARSNCMRFNPQILSESAAKNTLLFHQKHHKCQSKSKSETQQQQQLINGDENWITKNFQRREKAAIVIQSWYRSKKRELTEKEKAALTIQMALKGFKQRKQHEKNKAATLIQNAFRDYKIRKQLEN
ncbi:hypothetical protein PVAND_011576 [Polypedilum vanderplanki]|uniref:RIIa domain-containing protein n=1 Tax=Polypedilum vanderplanki TaxID=319348 RepID=A0A9J6CJ12_POLVA|nr:hypothetical protein PVAND_011576 [Polypedilum vanderplanki]